MSQLDPLTSAASAAEGVLRVDRLSKTYSGAKGARAAGIDNVSFELAPGTFFTLLGPSGCGKTTTLRSIAGLEEPGSGRIALGNQVFFDAVSGTSRPLNHRNIGMVFQSYAVWPHMTVFENVAFPLRVSRGRRYSATEIRAMVGQALETVDLTGLSGRPATRLSGGQQQRVALARAIVRNPDLLLLDEPLSNLDAKLRDEMRTALKQLQARIGITTIYVTHDQVEALELSDNIAIMSQGRVVQLGAPKDIYYRPANAFVADFMGATNILPGRIDGPVRASTQARVHLTDGSDIICHFDQAMDGPDVAISLRPEIIRLVDPTSAPEPDHNRLLGAVASTSFMGPTSKYTVHVGSGSLQASMAGAAAFEPGTSVALDFAQEGTIALPLA